MKQQTVQRILKRRVYKWRKFGFAQEMFWHDENNQLEFYDIIMFITKLPKKFPKKNILCTDK